MPHTKPRVANIGSVLSCPCGKNNTNERGFKLHSKFCGYTLRQGDSETRCILCGKDFSNPTQTMKHRLREHKF